MSLVFLFNRNVKTLTSNDLSLPIFPAKPEVCFHQIEVLVLTYSFLPPANYPCLFQCQTPNPTLWKVLSLQPSLVVLLSHIPPHSMILPLGSSKLPFSQDSIPLSLPRPVPPGATYPKFSPHFRPLAPPSPPQRKEAGVGREEGRHSARER